MSMLTFMADFPWTAPFWEGRYSLYQSVVTTLVLYPFLILAIRIFGKRSVSKMNNFDWIATVAIGAMIGSAIGFKEVTIVDTAIVMLVILSLQWLLTYFTSHSAPVEATLKAAPTLLVLRGRYIDETMNFERVSEGEIQAALRANGLTDISEAFAVVLETNAELSVISAKAMEDRSTESTSALEQFDMSDIDGGPDGQPGDAIRKAKRES